MWTNTCCSHQLTGFDPNEVDDREGVINLRVMGSKHAAVRKLQHELGIPSSQAWPTGAHRSNSQLAGLPASLLLGLLALLLLVLQLPSGYGVPHTTL